MPNCSQLLLVCLPATWIAADPARVEPAATAAAPALLAPAALNTVASSDTSAAPLAAAAAPAALQAEPSLGLTVYNGGFAVVRELFPIELKAGLNEITRSGVTAQVEPDSVILRDPSAQWRFSIVEQGYRSDAANVGLMLSMFEGQEIAFRVVLPGMGESRMKGRVLRSGYPMGQPLIQTNEGLMFELPGTPLFPALPNDSVLAPTLSWKIASDRAGTLPVELGYVSNGFSWKADYNLVAPAKGELVDLVGWVTVTNASGKRFDQARVKLMAGEVNRVREPSALQALGYVEKAARASLAADAPAVTEKSFDEYHLYTVANPLTLRDGETKQVEMARAAGVLATKLFVYEGAKAWSWYGDVIKDEGYGVQAGASVAVVREIANKKANQLGIPLPKGRVRFYQRDDDGQLEFLGENSIEHTPTDETLRLYVGNAFDVVGERTRTSFSIDNFRDRMDESFEIKLRNHKKEPIEVRVVERLYRWTNWEIQKSNLEWTKKDSQTIEYRVPVPAEGEAAVQYSVRYTW